MGVIPKLLDGLVRLAALLLAPLSPQTLNLAAERDRDREPQSADS